MSNGFQRVLDHIRSIAGSEAEKGRLFERLMKTYFTLDPIYRDRFTNVWLWPEWAATRPEFDGADIGIDLVAEEREDVWILRHSVQVLCTWYPNLKDTSGLFHIRFGSGTIHSTNRR